MERIVWLDNYNTGIDEIDIQHRQIVGYLNQLFEAKKARNAQLINEVIDGMIDYTMSHFTFEEVLMEQAEYPFARAHKSVHDTFVKRVERFRERFLAGEDISEEFFSVLKRWLVNHIQRDDAAYVRAVKAQLATLSKEEPITANGTTRGSWISRTVKKIFGV